MRLLVICFVIGNPHAKFHAGNYPLDLPRIGNGIGTLDRVFRFHLGQADLPHFLIIEEETVGKLCSCSIDGPGAAKQPLNGFCILVKIRHSLDILGQAAGKERAKFSFQAAARYNGTTGTGIPNHRTVHRTDGGKSVCSANVHSGNGHQFTFYQ